MGRKDRREEKTYITRAGFAAEVIPVSLVRADQGSPPRGGDPLAAERAIAVIQAWGKLESDAIALPERVKPVRAGWVLELDAIDQS